MCEKEEKTDTVFVFDFDDTLFHTTLQPITHPIAEPIPELCDTVLSLFKAAAKKDSITYIVTNATRKWLEHVIETYLKDISDWFALYSKIISARDLGTTKDAVFAILAARHQPRQFISFGDADTDQQAALHVLENFPDIRVKSVKTISTPDLQLLLQQHAFLLSNFDNVYNHETSLDYSIYMKNS